MDGHHKQVHEVGEHGAPAVGRDCAFRFGHEKNFGGFGHDTPDGDHGERREMEMHHEDAGNGVHIHKEDGYTAAAAAAGPIGCDGLIL